MYLQKTKEEILRQSLNKLANRTDITATSPGSVARTLVELLSDDLGDFYSILDFNLQQNVLSTATGRSLDLIGSLHNVTRKTLGTFAAVTETAASFYFYSETPVPYDIVIPRGTRVGLAGDDIVSRQHSFLTAEDAVIPVGRMRAYVSLVSATNDTIYTSGIGTLVSHGFQSPPGVIIRCKNTKPISPQLGMESDTDYRNRIIAEARRQAGGTDIAIRMTALGVNGVRNVTVRNGAYGMGSVEVIVNSENYTDAVPITNLVRNALYEIRPVGINMTVRTPSMIPLDVDVVITSRMHNSDIDDDISFTVKTTILRYINSLSIGDTMVINALIADIIGSYNGITDVTFRTLRANGSDILRRNFTPGSDEQIIPGNINVEVG